MSTISLNTNNISPKIQENSENVSSIKKENVVIQPYTVKTNPIAPLNPSSIQQVPPQALLNIKAENSQINIIGSSKDTPANKGGKIGSFLSTLLSPVFHHIIGPFSSVVPLLGSLLGNFVGGEGNANPKDSAKWSAIGNLPYGILSVIGLAGAGITLGILTPFVIIPAIPIMALAGPYGLTAGAITGLIAGGVAGVYLLCVGIYALAFGLKVGLDSLLAAVGSWIYNSAK